MTAYNVSIQSKFVNPVFFVQKYENWGKEIHFSGSAKKKFQSSI